MRDKLESKLEFLKKKKDEYLAQVVAINGAIQCLEELLKEPEIIVEEENGIN